ncbi:fasciclin domain-containing protein [Sediminitomix flava]|uniref:Fasciclin domain-containing protein n=1 Tax=Sediminitomix flava TaxID=379075 RepID=A0A315ZXG5_SEDFL|nr:fasciclin domain-containing protein [Sediminitomix flava]PWJ42037.1 fasciclin domain-containing protein [Sediminitomix flava]
MKSIKLAIQRLTVLLLFILFTQCGSFRNFGTTTVLLLISEREEMSHMYELIKEAELTDLLLSDTPHTFLIPTNAAFDNIQPAIMEEFMPVGDDKSALQAFIKNHFLVDEYNFEALSDMYTAENMIGDALTLRNSVNGIMVNQALIIENDLFADNGTIHVLDQILLPTPGYLEK